MLVAVSRVARSTPIPSMKPSSSSTAGRARGDDRPLAARERLAAVAHQVVRAARVRGAPLERARARQPGERRLQPRQHAAAQLEVLEAAARAAVALLQPRGAVTADREGVQRRPAGALALEEHEHGRSPCTRPQARARRRSTARSTTSSRCTRPTPPDGPVEEPVAVGVDRDLVQQRAGALHRHLHEHGRVRADRPLRLRGRRGRLGTGCRAPRVARRHRRRSPPAAGGRRTSPTRFSPSVRLHW